MDIDVPSGKGEAVPDACRLETTRAFYDDLAATYDLNYRDWDTSITRQGQSLDTLLTAVGVAVSDPVLDCACGIGTQTLGLAGCGRNLTGTDSSVVSVARARAEARKRGVRPGLAAADMRALPFGDNQFAAIICADNALPHLTTPEDLAAGLAEMTRVLCSGGVLLASTRDYDAARLDLPSSTPPLARNTPVGRVITFQLWRWHDDGERYDFEHFQLTEVEPERWQVARRTASYWALTRRQLAAALRDAGLGLVTWHEPEQSGFFQPVVIARRP
jgi:glycine/sarcosine N-methyltransferase